MSTASSVLFSSRDPVTRAVNGRGYNCFVVQENIINCRFQRRSEVASDKAAPGLRPGEGVRHPRSRRSFLHLTKEHTDHNRTKVVDANCMRRKIIGGRVYVKYASRVSKLRLSRPMGFGTNLKLLKQLLFDRQLFLEIKLFLISVEYKEDWWWWWWWWADIN